MRGLKIARIHGVDLKIHFSLIFLLLYVLFVASAQFPFILQESGIAPQQVIGPPVLWALIFAIALFLSVVLHEFAHVLVAQGMGVRVRGITLMMLGGVSEMEKIPEKRYAEFKVSIVGPLSSLLIAGGLFLLEHETRSPDLELFAFWLARINLTLAIFNLLPAFPLDGGRALRSILAARSGMARGTELAVRIAKIFAWVLGAWGLLTFNILLMLIALFIYSAASSELVVSLSRGMLQGLKVSDAWTEVAPVSAGEPLERAADRMIAARTRALPVEVPSGVPTIVSSDLLRRVPRKDWSRTNVSQVSRQVRRFVRPTDELSEIFPELAAEGALPVRDDGALRGVLNYADVADLLDYKRLAA